MQFANESAFHGILQFINQVVSLCYTQRNIVYNLQVAVN